MKTILITILSALILFGCKKKIINEIPEHCYTHEFAQFSIDNQLQEIKDNVFQGTNLSYMYGVKPNGEWSVGLESEDYELTINVAQSMTNEVYGTISDEAWLKTIEENGTYTLENNPRLQQLFLNDLTNSTLYTNEHIDSSLVKVTVNDIIKDCRFMEVEFNIYLRKDETAKHVTGKVKATIPKKKTST